MKHICLLLPLSILISFTACVEVEPRPFDRVVSKEYFAGGKIRSKFIVTDKTGQTGLLKEYAKKGHIVSTVQMRDGVKHGLERGYDSLGRVLWEKHYVDGKEDVSKKVYYPGSKLDKKLSSQKSSASKDSVRWRFSPQVSSSKSQMNLRGDPMGNIIVP